MHLFKVLICTLPMCLALVNCATQDTSETEPNNSSTRQNKTPNTKINTKPDIENNVFYVRQSIKDLYLNDVKIDGINALERYLRKADKAVIAIAVHRCADSEAAKSLVNLSKRYTDTPIPYKAYGKLTDKACILK